MATITEPTRRRDSSRRAPRSRRTGMAPRMRKLVLVVHLLAAGAWIGVDVIVAGLVLVGHLTDDPRTAGVAYQALGRFVVAPMLVAAVLCLVTGVLLGLGTRWGLTRYWWVLVKLLMTVAMCVLIVMVLRPGMAAVTLHGEALAAGGPTSEDLTRLFFPPAVSLTALTVATVLSVFKPWGRVRNRRIDGDSGR